MLFKGVSAFGGQVEGKICIVHDHEEFSHCEEDDIVLLVGVKPNAELVRRVKAVLAVHGGITSHAAITARENNKPSVVGIKEDILNYINNGDKVVINADEGLVELLK